MHEMMFEKHQRLEQIKSNEEALARLDATIASHITPNLVRAHCIDGVPGEVRSAGRGERCWLCKGSRWCC